MNIENFYHETIIDYGTKPKNFHILKKKNFTRLAINKLCGDNLKLFVLIENNVIKNISFKGTGCIISIASASIMTEIVKKKTIKEALIIFQIFKKLLINKNIKNNKKNIISNNLIILTKIKLLPSRVKCVTLAWFALHTILTSVIK